MDERELSRLMHQSLQGDTTAYRSLLDAVVKILRPFLKSSLNRTGQNDGSSSEDVLQEVLLAIHQKRETYDPERPFLPWMYAIARYKTTDFLRNAKVRSRFNLTEDMSIFEGPTPSQNPDAPAELLETLPKKQRTLIELVKLQGLSIQEAALKTGFSISDVKVSIHRGIQALRKRKDSL